MDVPERNFPIVEVGVVFLEEPGVAWPLDQYDIHVTRPRPCASGGRQAR